MLMSGLELKGDDLIIYLLSFCRKQQWPGPNAFLHPHAKKTLPCKKKRAFIRDIIPRLCAISKSSLRKSVKCLASKHQMPVWTTVQTTAGQSGVGLDYSDPVSFTSTDITFNWSKQVGTAILLMLSEDVLMSTLQSMSTSRGRETEGLKNGSVRPSSTWQYQTLEPVTTTTYILLYFWPWETYNFSAIAWFRIIFTLQ